MNTEFDKLRKEIRHLRQKLKSYPEGTLFCVHNGKYVKWFQSNHSNPIYIRKKQRSLAVALAEKKFYSLQLESLLLKEKTMLQYEKKQQEIEEKTALLISDNSPYLELLKENILGMPVKFQDWMDADYPRNTLYSQNLVYKTLSGHMVRSKSEVMIANSLFQSKIPYRYECMLELDAMQFFPDFTILHPGTGELFYWEHLGLMDDHSYCEKAFSKLKTYSLCGIIPSINLILTFETRKHPLDIETIQKKIAEYLT